MRSLVLTILLGLVFAPAARAQQLSAGETAIRQWVASHHEQAIRLLEEAVNIPSGTFNPAGVRAVGEVFRRELTSLGFSVRWTAAPPAMRRAGHLIAVRRGTRATPNTKRLLLIGHLDTVFEGAGQRFVRRDTVGRGAGTSDMKGGDVVIIQALKALHATGALDEMAVTVFFTGDEESPGQPLSQARQALIQAAKESDIALAFEGGNAATITNARRGGSMWTLTVEGRQSHSSGIFQPSVGYGAVYEAARILNEFRTALSKEPHLTLSPGLIVGGTEVSHDSVRVAGTATGKVNIIAKAVRVQGDLRFLTGGQLDSARATMRSIVSDNLPGTNARITFMDGYPGMPPTEGSRTLVSLYDQTSQDLGYPSTQANDPDQRGAGDISFAASLIDGLDGLGPEGFGAHSPDEGVYLPSLIMAAERTAVFMHRLTRAAQPTP